MLSVPRLHCFWWCMQLVSTVLKPLFGLLFFCAADSKAAYQHVFRSPSIAHSLAILSRNRFCVAKWRRRPSASVRAFVYFLCAQRAQFVRTAGKQWAVWHFLFSPRRRLSIDRFRRTVLNFTTTRSIYSRRRRVTLMYGVRFHAVPLLSHGLLLRWK